MADITEVKRMLADRAQGVAEMLLPDGRKDGAEWRVGSTAGEKGQSLGVHLTGEKAGIWYDFATGEGGDLLDLWVATRGGTLSDALRDAKRWLGISDPMPYREPARSYVRPPKPKGATGLKGGPLDYLTGKRAIPLEILQRYKVAARDTEIIFPFILPDGTLALAKAREAVDGAAPKPTAKDCEPILFGWQAVPEDARELVITEGEIDALSWAAYGRAAVSVPFGGGKGAKQQWIESDFDRLDRFERIYLSTDMDKPGEEAASEIADRLGRHRCYRVKLPHKDANECLVAGVSREAMDAAIAAAANLDPDGLRRPADFLDEVTNLFWPAKGEHIGYTLPYTKLDGKLYLRPAEVTLWSGASGTGKSQILSDCIPKWIDSGSRVCLASFEMKCAQTLKRLVKQTGGVDRPDISYIERVVRWLDRGLLLYERVGKANVVDLLAIFDYARAKYGCDQFVIDSLMRLGVAQDDYNGQEGVMYRLVDWAIDHGVHVHLVAHARKGERGQGAPETEDIKGAMEIGANAFNILTVWRNRKIEEDVRVAEDEVEKAKSDDVRAAAIERLDELLDKPGVIINVAKQRNGDFEGKVRLYFNRENYQYACNRGEMRVSRSYVD